MKRVTGDLACFGGVPLFGAIKPIGQLSVPDENEFLSYARAIYAHMPCSEGTGNVLELERQLQKYHDVAHCVAYANASLAIIAAVQVLVAGRKGEVIMPAFTYSGLPHLVQWAGQLPRFCDIDHDTHTLSTEAVVAAISEHTTAILAVHQVNSPCDIDRLQEIAVAHHVPLIFDSVHGFGCTYKGRPIGAFGCVEIFSLHATKLLNGFEGGYATTNDATLAAKLRTIRNHGYDDSFEVQTLGMNARLNEIHAACALSCMRGLSGVIARNRSRYDAYRECFADIPGISWIQYRDDGERMNYEFALLSVPCDWPLSRDQLVAVLRKENALARAYYSPPLHLSEHCPASVVPPSLPVTELLSQGIIQMPVGEQVNAEDIVKLADLFRFLYENGSQISDCLQTGKSN